MLFWVWINHECSSPKEIIKKPGHSLFKRHSALVESLADMGMNLNSIDGITSEIQSVDKSGHSKENLSIWSTHRNINNSLMDLKWIFKTQSKWIKQPNKALSLSSNWQTIIFLSFYRKRMAKYANQNVDIFSVPHTKWFTSLKGFVIPIRLMGFSWFDFFWFEGEFCYLYSHRKNSECMVEHKLELLSRHRFIW